MADGEDDWSHIAIEALEGMARIIQTSEGPDHVFAYPEFRFVVLLVAVDGTECLRDFCTTYAKALARAKQDAVMHGFLEIIDKVQGGHC